MRLLAALFLLVLAGCAGVRPSDEVLILRNAEIHQDATWQGRVVIDGSVKVFKGATLTIAPGTDVAFVRHDEDQDGLGDGVLIVEGSLHAEGTRSMPVRFRSAAADPRPGDWLEIRVDFSRDVHLRYCEITDSAYTLHAHFTRGVVEDCTIRRNIDGCRLGQASFVIRNCLIENNQGKGINFRNTTIEVTRNIIRHNGSGIFLFENDREAVIHHNNLYGNEDNFRLGDFYTDDVQLADNWWGTADPEAAARTIYDRRKDPEIGTVYLQPASAWIPETGPRDALRLSVAWTFATGGFVDASFAAAGETLYVPGWDGHLYALDPQGRPLWSRDLGDVMDASPALGGEAVYIQTWGREVFALERRSGKTRWQFTYSPSRADDHRQGGALVVAELLLLPAWNGTLFALESGSGIGRWQHQAGQPLRSAPVWDGRALYQASGAGSLSALRLDGARLWEARLGSPLLAAPAATPEGPVVVTRDGTLIALDVSGEERWRTELAEPCFYGAPVFDRGSIYLGTAGGSLWKIDAATGIVIWRQQAPGPTYATPLLVSGRLFIGDNDGTLFAVGVESGDVLTTFEVPREIQGTPVLFGDRLVFGSRDHHVYALQIGDSSAQALP